MRRRFYAFLSNLLCSALLLSCSTGLSYEKTEETVEEKAPIKVHAMTFPEQYPAEVQAYPYPDVPEGALTRARVEAIPVATDDMTAMERRMLILEFFQLQLSFLWKTNLDLTDYDTTYYEFQDDTRPIRKETLYGGIPYQSGGSGNLYRVLEYYDEATGVFDLARATAENGGYGEGGKTVNEKTDAGGNVIYKQYYAFRTLFNQCSSSPGWAWNRVVNSAKIGGATGNANPTRGYIPVGLYTYPNMYILGKFGGMDFDGYDTQDVIRHVNEKNGSDTMYRCYAQTKPADCLVSTGHMMMVKKVEIVRDASGALDAAKSCITVLEQIENWGERSERDGTPFFRQGGVDRVYSFQKLQKQKYIPFTFAELLDENDPWDKKHLAYYREQIQSKNQLSSSYYDFGFDRKRVNEISGEGVEKAEIYTNLPEGCKALNPSLLSELRIGSNYAISDLFFEVLDENGEKIARTVWRADPGHYRSISMKKAYTCDRALDDNGNRITVYQAAEAALGEGVRVRILMQLSTGELATAVDLPFAP